jgi:protein ImuB
MRYAVVQVPGFALHALLRAEPGLRGRPVGIVAGEGSRARVVDASVQAAGVDPGLAATLALSRCPGIVLRGRDPAAETEAGRLLVAAAFLLSPRVEATGPGVCTVDLQGADAAATQGAMRRCAAELASLGLPARVGAGATTSLAAYAAGTADPVRVVEDAAGFLAPLPLALAEPTTEQAAVLSGWGIATLGGLTALPRDEVGRRLGTAGVQLWDRAAGRATRALRLVEQAVTFAAQWEYDPPVESSEPLLFKLRRYAERIAMELRGAGCVAEQLALTLFLEDDGEHRRSFRLPEPGADVDGWLRILEGYLADVRTASGVCGVRLVAAPTRAPQRQQGLFDAGLRDPALFWENLARLSALVGDDRVGTPEPLDTHHPDAFVLRRPAESVPAVPEPVHPDYGPALRRFRPPWPVAVACEAGLPVRLGPGRLEGRVVASRGPWRVAGAWWTPGAWEIETWRVELEGGGVYQLARVGGDWRAEGVLD